MSTEVPGAPPRIGLEEMARVVTDEAIRIEGSQAALVAGGLRVTPHEGELRRAEVMRQIGLLLDRLKPHMPAIREIVQGGGKNWTRRRS